MRVLYFGTYDRAYPRNAQVISALRGAGVEVREQHRAVWERRHNWSVGLAPDAAGRRGRAQPAQVAGRRARRRRADRRLPRPLRPARREAGRAGAAGDLQPARLALRHARRRPAAVPPRLARRRRRAHRRPAGIPARRSSSSPTPTPTPRSSARSSAWRPDRVEVCFVGAEDRLFRPGWQPEAPFHALFVGKLIPLHGLETILAAAALAPEIPFRDRRQRPARAPARRPARRTSSGCRGSSTTSLPDEIQAAGCALGIFGTTAEGGARDPQQGLPGDSPARRRSSPPTRPPPASS